MTVPASPPASSPGPAGDGIAPRPPYTEATTGYWQALLDDDAVAARRAPPWRFGVPVPVDPGRWLLLPIRPRPGAGDRAVASLIANQASFAVADALADAMTALARPLDADTVVGLPTLGMVFAPRVAQGLGLSRYVPMGYSRKFWYDDALSAPVNSLTTPDQAKRIRLDPNQLSLVRGRRVVIVDDAISTGGTAAAVWALLESLGAEVLALVVAMRQGHAWRAALGPQRAQRVLGVFDSPMLRLGGDGWHPES